MGNQTLKRALEICELGMESTIRNSIWLFGVLALMSAFATTFPFILNMQVTPVTDATQILNSDIYGYTQIFELSFCSFVFLDTIVGAVITPNHYNKLDSVSLKTLVVILTIIDGTVFYVARPRGDVGSLLVSNPLRINAFIITASIYLVINGGSIWNNRYTKLAVVFSSMGTLCMSYCFLFSAFVNSALSTISLAFMVSALAIFAYNSSRYFLVIWEMLRTSRLTDKDFMSGLNVLAIFGMLAYLVVIFATLGWKPYDELTVSYFALNNCGFAVYLAVAFIFQKQSYLMHISKLRSELEAKRMFVNYISHEIRTPLNTLDSGMELLELELHALCCGPEVMDIVQDSKKAADAALTVVNDLLTFDKLEDGALMLEMEDVEAWSLVQEAVQSFRTQARKSHIELLVFQVDKNGQLREDNEKMIIHADAHKIEQVVRNLVSNGLKFTPPGGKVTAKVSIKEVIGPDGMVISRELILDVMDTGVGLTVEQQSMLFHSINYPIQSW